MTNPGPADHTRARRTLRVLGLVLLALGMAGVVAGGVLFARGALSDDIDSMGRNALVGIMLFGGGGVLAVAGVGVLSAGFSRQGYVPAEGLSILRDPATAPRRRPLE